MGSFSGSERLAVGSERNVAGQLFQNAPLKILEPSEQCRSDQARRQPEQNAVEQAATDNSQLEALGLGKENARKRSITEFCGPTE